MSRLEKGISLVNGVRKCGPQKVLVAKYVCIPTAEGKLVARRTKFATRLMEHGVNPEKAKNLASHNVTTLKRAPPINKFVDKLPLTDFARRGPKPSPPLVRLRRGPPPERERSPSPVRVRSPSPEPMHYSPPPSPPRPHPLPEYLTKKKKKKKAAPLPPLQKKREHIPPNSGYSKRALKMVGMAQNYSKYGHF